MIWERAVAENAWQLDDGLYRILLPLPWAVPFVNTYVVESRSEFALVDCGANWLPSLRALGRALKAIGVPPGGLGTLLLTHGHPDHANAAGAINAYFVVKLGETRLLALEFLALWSQDCLKDGQGSDSLLVEF